MKFFFIFALVFVFQSCSQQESTNHLHGSLNELRIEVDSLSKVIELRENEPDKNYWFSDDYDGIELSEKGILHPQQFIDSSLQPQVNLIPTKAVLGGTMAFGKTQVLSPKWVIAEYSDGHLWGVALFEYEVNKEGKVEFKLLSNHLY